MIFYRRILLLSFLFLGFSMSNFAQTTPTRNNLIIDILTITLDEAVDIALSSNPTIIIAGKEVEIKKQAKNEVIWNLLPEATINGSYSNTIKKQTMAMDLGGEVQTFKVGMKHNYTGSLNVNLPIFAPALYKTMTLSKEDVNLALEKSRASKLDLINQVVKAYFQILLAQDSYMVLNKSLLQAEDNLSVVSSKFKFGKVSEYDQIRADVQMRNIRPSVIAAENAVRLAKMQLKVLLGISSPVDLVIDDKLDDYGMVLKEDGSQYDFEYNYSIDLSNNSDLKQLDLSERMLKQSVKLRRTNYLPIISLDYNYTYMALENRSNVFDYSWYPTSSIGVKVSIPLFRGSNMTKVRQSKIELSKMYFMKQDAERQLRMQAASYLDNMKASSEQLESNQVSVLQALKGRTIAKKMYEVGKGTILELNDSEIALVQAQLAYNQAIYDFLSAKCDYSRVIGIENFYNNIKNK